MAENGDVQEWVIVDAEDKDEVLRIAQENGVEVQVFEERGFEPVTTVTLALLGGAAAVSAVAYLIDQRKGGQIIDLRPTAPKTAYRSRNVTYGLVIIIASDGQVTVEVKEPKGMFGQVVEALRGITVDVGKAGVGAVAEAAKAAVGDKATIQATSAQA
jgi:hypothetical protein